MEASFKTTIGLLEHLPGMHYLFIPEKIVKQFGGKFPIRVICTVNNSLEFQGGMVFLSQGNAYITISKPRMKQAGVKLHDTVQLNLKTDNSEYGTEMPAELETLLAQDDEGNERFMALKKSMQRYVINYVKSVKSIDKRIERSMLLIGNLKQLKPGEESFREMLGLPRDREI